MQHRNRVRNAFCTKNPIQQSIRGRISVEEMVRTTLKAKGIQVPEEDIPLLVGFWQKVLWMKEAANQAKLAELDIGLCHTLKGGMVNEQ